MSPSDKRQSITLILGGVAAVLAAVIGLLVSDVPIRLRSFVSSPTAWAIALTCTLPILTILVTNQVSLLLKTSTDREDTIRDVMRFLPNASLIIHFATSEDAMRYLIQNLPLCKHVYNTRLGSQQVEESDPINVMLTKRFDEVVWEAIRKGVGYDLIISPDHQRMAGSLINTRRTYAARHTGVGNCCCWVLPPSTVPLFHFCILEFADHKELLMGWALTSSRSFGEKVFLVRDERLVQYFRDLFETYVGVAHVV